jgi:hypothetical protein
MPIKVPMPLPMEEKPMLIRTLGSFPDDGTGEVVGVAADEGEQPILLSMPAYVPEGGEPGAVDGAEPVAFMAFNEKDNDATGGCVWVCGRVCGWESVCDWGTD